MCGIAGIIGKHSERIDAMVSAQRHRGPDATRTCRFDGGALGHNRLSIIDLSDAANQPFQDASQRYTLVFNGEIYNYRELRDALLATYDFKTDSDTEVLLAAYLTFGSKVLERLNGMFAFAIWDQERQELFAARDRFGVKPFYYSKMSGDFIFASEIKTLHAAGLPEIPAEETWASYFVHGTYGQTDDTFWEGVRQLPGGHSLTWNAGRVVVAKWYHFVERIACQQKILEKETAKGYYTELLDDSIALRFRADVPVGFNLSGGLDSSLLLALVDAAEGHEKIDAFTFYTGDPAYDELPWVEKMIQRTGHNLHKVRLDAVEVPALAASMAAYQDEPYGGIPTLAYSLLFKKAREMGSLVLLDGQGMDEQWAGYDYYRHQSDSIIQGVASPLRPEILSIEFRRKAQKPEYPSLFGNRLQDLQYRDLFHTKIPRALRFNDRISMAFGTELREPFLDYRLVEFAFSQPQVHKIADGTGKALLREIAFDKLGPELALAPKRPLQTPQREWLSGPLKPFVQEAFEWVMSSDYGIWFDRKALNGTLKAYFAGHTESSFHIWQVISVALMTGFSPAPNDRRG